MTLGLRSRLFVASVGIFLAAIAATGFYLEHELRQRFEAYIETELQHHARALASQLEVAAVFRSAEVTTIARRVAEASALRITIVAPDGRVLADSSVPASRLAQLDNHGQRPEVRRALRTGHGAARRTSRTVEAGLLYVAVPFRHPAGSGVVRVARPLGEVDEALSRVRFLVALAGVLSLVIAAALSALASHLASRALRNLLSSARSLAAGQRHKRLTVTSVDELGGIAGTLNAMADEVERTVAALAAERARFEVVLDSMGEAVIAVDAETSITLMNPAAAKLLGVPRAPFGKHLIEAVRVPALQELIAGRGSGPHGNTVEFDLPRTRRRVLARCTPMRGQGGLVLVMHDVTEIRRLETVRRDLVANVSHELRTPVSIIRANAETLLSGALADPVHGPRLLEALHRNAERLSLIIADLLDLSRIEAGRYLVELVEVAVHEVATRTAEAMERAARDKQIEVAVEIEPALQVQADVKALEQILTNLLDNAIKYTQSGGHVWLRARQLPGVVRIEVSDDGPGIEPRHHERIFERFYRVDPGRTRAAGGTGLGLAIVKHLAEIMHGRVGVASATPRGCVFWVELPASPGDAVDRVLDPSETTT